MLTRRASKSPLLPRPPQAAYLLQGINSSVATLPNNLDTLAGDIEAVAGNVRHAGSAPCVEWVAAPSRRMAAASLLLATRRRK